MKLHHGGCHGCTMQDKHGLKYCETCQYLKPDWSLIDKNDSHITDETIGYTQNEIHDFVRFLSEKGYFYNGIMDMYTTKEEIRRADLNNRKYFTKDFVFMQYLNNNK